MGTRLCVNRHVMVWFQVMKDEEVFFMGNSEFYGHLELSRPPPSGIIHHPATPAVCRSVASCAFS